MELTDRLTGWMKSTRSIAVVIFVVGLTAGLAIRVVSSEQYINAAMLALGAYFGKRDEKKES